MKEIKDTFGSFLEYLKKPYYTEKLEGFNRSTFFQTNVLFLAKYLISIAWVLTINKWLRVWFDIERSEITNADDQNLLQLFLVVTFAYPIAEELLFRFWIRSKKWLMLTIICLFAVLSSYWIAKGFEFPSLLVKRIALVTLPLISTILLVGFYHKKSRKGLLHQTMKKLFPFIFYLSVIQFALLHVFNFETDNAFVPLLMIMPQLIAGMFFGYARMKFGMWSALYMHMLGNAITFVFSELLGW